jgi:PKD domain-containing protein
MKPSRIAKRLIAPALLAATLVGVQAVLAAPPEPSFTVTGPNGSNTCGQYTLASTSQDTDGDIATVAWNIDGTAGAGNTSPFTTTFAQGSHTVNISVTDTDAVDGAVDTVPGIAQTFTVGNGGPPNAAFTANNNSPQPNETVTFNAGTSSAPGGGSITRYQWDLGGASSTDYETDTGVLGAVPQAFATTGFHPVNLKVTDNCGQTDTVIGGGVFVNNPPPTASFTVDPPKPRANQDVTITSTSTDQLGGSIAKYEWDLDDDDIYNEGGTTGELDASKVTTRFPNSGSATIKLRVTDDSGAIDDSVRSIPISGLPLPSAGLTYLPANPLPGQAITFTSTSSASTAAGATALDGTQWDFDYVPGGFTSDAAGPAATTSFPTPGPKTVAIKATDTAGGEATTSVTVVVNAPPQASFTVAPSKPAEGKEVTFASTSGDPDGPLVKQEWDLNNDGKFEKTGAVTSTTKLKKGPRKIALRVTDSKGAQATSTQVITVKAPVLRNPQDVGSTLSYLRHSWGVAVVGFTIKTPAQTSVAVSCKGHGCPHGTFHKRTRKKAATLVFSKLTGNLRAGAKVNIVFTRTGRITGWDVYTVGRGKTSLREGCKPSGAKKQKRCP